MFTAIIFIAEIIIAYQVLSVIIRLDKKVCEANCIVKEFNPLAETFMRYIRMQVASVYDKISKAVKFINEQRKKTLFKIALIIGINLLFIMLQIKKVRVNKAINLAVAVLDIIADIRVL